MTKTWQVFFTGKFQFFLITTVASFLVFILIIFRMTAKEGGEFEDNLIEGLFGFSLFIIAWFNTFIGFIRKKKIPLKIVLDPDSEEITFTYPGKLWDITNINKKQVTYSFKELAFTYHEYLSYTALVFFKKIKSRRGHFVYNEYMSIVGLFFGFGWKVKILNEISDTIKQHIEEYDSCDKGFISRIIE